MTYNDDDQRPALEISRRVVLASMAALALAACSSTSSPSAASSAPATPTPTASGTPSDGATPDPGASSPEAPTSATASPSTSRRAGSPATEVTHGPRTTQAVALTFHGAGDPALAQRILASAERAGAHVTILAVGTWLQQYPTVADRILRGGHELGNHTLHHRPMRLMDEATAYAEIVGGQRLVHAHTTATLPTWFRPSGTPHATPHILAAAGRAGYRTSLSFDMDPADYTDPGSSAVVSRVLASVKGGSIVSLHLGHVGTATALPRILDGLQARGLAAVTVSALIPGVSP